jgi:hypothetical protein
MTTDIKDKLDMYVKVQDTLRAYTPDYVFYPKLARGVATLDTQLDNIFAVIARFDTDKTQEQDDRRKRLKLEQIVSKLGQSLKLLSNALSRNTSIKRLSFSLEELQQMRDIDIYLKVIHLKQFAQDHLLELAAYNIQAADLRAMDTYLNEFLLQAFNTQDENEAHAELRQELDHLFTETDTLLLKMDDCMESYSFEQPLLWEEYLLARIVPKSGHRIDKPTFQGVLAPGQLEAVVQISYTRERRFIISNTGQAMIHYSLSDSGTSQHQHLIVLPPNHTRSLQSGDLNGSEDACYLVMENKDKEQTASYEIWLR